jgi:hypothetical protein
MTRSKRPDAEHVPYPEALNRFLEGEGAQFVESTVVDLEAGLRYRTIEHRPMMEAFAREQGWDERPLGPAFIHERCAAFATPDAPRCVGCGRGVSGLAEYRDGALAHGYPNALAYLRDQEGTLNKANGHFRCTPCYVRAGQPKGMAP